jgi:phosphoribosylformimino-5-aminoimidazole carboxamide ribotide isomerase
MIVYPAVDLRDGKVVRLKEGKPDHQITFSHDPLTTARRWMDAGAQWLHVVNLDGAFGQASVNLRVLETLAALPIRIQFGGGLRTQEDIATAFSLGAARVVLGTVAVREPHVTISALARYGPDKICVALDARDGQITTHGWQTQTTITPATLGRQMAAHGLRHALFTDVSRDGQLQGVNVEATAALAQETGLSVIASGGVQALADLEALRAAGHVAGVIVGMALYTGRFTLEQAIEIAGDQTC